MAQNDEWLTRQFGLWVKVLRKRLGMTQVELADIVGTNKEPISRWESGRRTPSALNVLRLLALATEDERQAIMDKAMQDVDDTIMLYDGHSYEAVHCSKCERALRVRDYTTIGWPAPPLVQQPGDPYVVRYCAECRTKNGWPP